MNRRPYHIVCALPSSLLSAAATADIPPDYDFQWANIAQRNNAPYTGSPGGTSFGRGSVPYAYRMSKLEITTAQWVDFLNMAVRQGVDVDFNGYDLEPTFAGASKVGGQYVANDPMRPCIGMTWRAGAYYCNWLHNGKQESWASCLDGAYDASTFGGGNGDEPFTDQLTRSPGAKFWIPSLDEWLKAAHYNPDKDGPGQGGWWLHPYQSNSPAIPGAPGVGQTSAGWHPGNGGEFFVRLGAYAGSVSAYGLWDLSGGASEWIEEPALFENGGWHLRRWDGSSAGGLINPDHINSFGGDEPYRSAFNGFRIASQIPAPGVTGTGLFVVAWCYSKRRR